MTKQEFLNGKVFTIPNYYGKGDSTFYYAKNENGDLGYISKQIRNSKTDKVIMDDFEAGVDKIGPNTVSTFTIIMGQTIKQRFNFKDFTLFEE